MKFLPLILLSATPSGAALVPSASITDWTPGTRTGVPGGIAQYFDGGAATGRDAADEIDITAAPYNADDTGVTDCTSIINTVLVDLYLAHVGAGGTGGNKVVKFPAGTFNIASTVTIPANFNDVTFRGSGASTRINAGNRVFAFGASGWMAPSSAALVTAGMSQDSTAITVTTGADYTAGELVLIVWEDQMDDAAIEAGGTIVFGVGGPTGIRGLRSQVTRVVSKASNVLTISPGIYHAPQAGLDSWVLRNENNHKHLAVGFEDFTVDMAGTSASSAIQIQHGFGCWVSNVKVINSTNYGVEFFDSLQCEGRTNNISNDTLTLMSNRGGFLVNTCAGLLIEDNIVVNKFPGVEVNQGTSGSVFGYNMMETESVAGALGIGIISNHGPHNSHNLYEGNITNGFLADGYFGSVSEDTVHRNWITGTNSVNEGLIYPLALKRFTRKYNLTGNIIGKNGQIGGYPVDYGRPNIGNGDSTGTATPSTGNFWADWNATATLTTRVSDTAGTITLASGSAFTGQLIAISWGAYPNSATFTAGTVAGSVVPFTGAEGTTLPDAATALTVYFQPGGYQERDMDVALTTTEKGNYVYAASGAAGSMSTLGGDTLPDSLYRSSKPAFFGALTWPAFAPTAPNDAGYEDIPAGYRFVNDSGPPSGGGTVTATTVNAGTLNKTP